MQYQNFCKNISLGSQYEPFVPSPLVSNSKNYAAIENQTVPTFVMPPPRSSNKNPHSLYKQTLENGNVNKYVTPYRHDSVVMNADVPPPVPPMRYSHQRPPMRIHPKIEEVDELREEEEEFYKPHQVQFLTPRVRHHHQSCAYNNNGSLKSSSARYTPEGCHFNAMMEEEDRVKLVPKPTDRCVLQCYDRKTRVRFYSFATSQHRWS